MTISPFLGKCILTIRLEISIVSHPTLFFFKVILAILDSLYIHMNFKVRLSISTEKICVGFDWEYIEFLDHFGKIDILTILSLPIHEHSLSLTLFNSPVTSLSSIL